MHVVAIENQTKLPDYKDVIRIDSASEVDEEKIKFFMDCKIPDESIFYF